MAAKWPTAVATDADLSIAVNSLQTTLSGAIDSVVTSIPLVSTSGFPTVGYVTIDAEVISYTGIAGGNLTGAVRGADGTVAAAHLAAAQVGATVVAAHHNSLKDEIKATESWLDTVIGKGTAVTAPEFENLDGVTSPIQPQLAALAPLTAIDRLRVTAQGTPGTTVAVAAGVYTKSDGTATVTFAGGNSPAFAVVTANSRIDILTINDSGVLAITQGTQAASPVAPTYPTDKIVLAEVTVSQTTGPAITQAMIKDVRPYLNLGSGGGASTQEYVAYTVGTASGTYTGSTTVFDLPFTYTTNGKNIEVYYNGQQMKFTTDYAETSGTRITFTSALVSGAAVWFRAVVTGAVSAPAAVSLYREDYIVGTALNNYTGSLTVFNLVNTYSVGGKAMLSTLDGDVQTVGASADYLETNSNTVTYNTALVAGQRISFIWSQTAPATSGTVNSGTTNQLAFFATSGTAVSGTPAVTTDGSTVSVTLPAKIKGTATNDSAAAGDVGEYVAAGVGTQNTPATGLYGDAAFIDLTPGDWDVTGMLTYPRNTATWSRADLGISTTSGNSSAGLGAGNFSANIWASSATTPVYITLVIPCYRLSLSITTRVYLKMMAVFTSGQPQTDGGIIQARRVR